MLCKEYLANMDGQQSMAGNRRLSSFEQLCPIIQPRTVRPLARPQGHGCSYQATYNMSVANEVAEATSRFICGSQSQ
jgi:hypothetical protein